MSYRALLGHRFSVAALVAAGLALGLGVVSCSGSGSAGDDGDDGVGAASAAGADAGELATPSVVLVANTPGTLAVGAPQRVMTALIGDGPNAYLGGPDQPVTIRFAPLGEEGAGVEGSGAEGPGGEGPGGEVAGEWLTTNATSLGLYVTSFTFAEAGQWEVTATSEGRELGRTLIEVVERSSVPGVGDPVPPSVTPTATDPDGIVAISSDLEPDPDFYRLSIADAVDNGRPTLIVFATPAFCKTALCGPTLDFVKGAVAGRDDLDVVHVEPYDLALARDGTLEPIPTMSDWGLVTEPWVFVVDADGRVTASFEGIIGQAEMERALDAL